MIFDKRDLDLGKVKKGEQRNFSYKFVNRGDVALTIANVSACECTTTDYPRKPIRPGESGELKVTFDSKEKDYEELIDIEILLDQTIPGTDEIPVIEKVYYKFGIEK